MRVREQARYAQARRSERDRLRSAPPPSRRPRTAWRETVAVASQDARRVAGQARTLAWCLAADGRIAPSVRTAIARELGAWARATETAKERRHPPVVISARIRRGGSCLDSRTRTVSVRPGGAHARLALLTRLAGDMLLMSPDLRSSLADTAGEGAESLSALYGQRAKAREGHARALARSGLSAWADLLVADAAPRASLWWPNGRLEPVPAAHGQTRAMDVARERRFSAVAWAALCAAGLLSPPPKARPLDADTKVAKPAKLAKLANRRP